MDDPFVKRMMERTKARQRVLGRVIEAEDKENSHDSKLSSSSTVTFLQNEQSLTKNPSCMTFPSPLGQANNKSTDAIYHTSNSEIFVSKAVQSPETEALSHHKDCVSQTSENSSSGKRFKNLALRSQRMKNWEDDYTYHSVCGGSVKEVESSNLDLHASENVSKLVSTNQHEVAENQRISYSTLSASARPPSESEQVSSKTSLPSKYYYGESLQLATTNPKEGVSLTQTVSASTYAHQNTPQSPNMSYHSAKSHISTPSSQSNKSSVSAMSLSTKHTPQSKNIFRCSSSSQTPSRRLAWDKQLIDSLEAQGFTPSDSKSKLSYDFEKDRSPIRDICKSSPVKIVEGQVACTVPQPPKIVSCYAKSPGSSPQKKKQNRDSSPVQERSRDQSPSKVGNLRSRWEQHIRNASPEKNVSPTRKAQSPSPTRKVKSGYTSSTKKMNHDSSVSPTKSCPSLPGIKTSDASHMSGFQYGSDVRRSLRSLSPHKPCAAATKIVKGVNPMPDCAPVIDNPFASVRERIAAFASVMDTGFKGPQRDPAELSIQDRLNIFEKKKGTALVPKAPSGQPVLSKVLQPGQINTSKNNSKLNQTYVCQSSAKIDTKSSSSNSKSLGEQRRQFEHTEDNWRANDINKKIAAERKLEMNVLFNRFKKPRQHRDAERREDSESEYPADSDSESSTDTNSLDIQISGPPKPPRTFESESPTNSFIPPPKPQMSRDHSPCRRLNSTEVGESTSPSPRKKEYVPRVKPGCLFPSLSDIESHSEAQDSQDDDDVRESSFAESVLTSTSIDSLGKQIQRIAQPVHQDPRPLSTISEGFEFAKSSENMLSGDSALEAIQEIDDALDEAFSDDDPTPKRSRNGDDDISCSTYKTPKLSSDSDDFDGQAEISLAHSVSMYRKQKPAEVHYTPLRQIVRKPEIESPSVASPVSPSVNISERIRGLQEEEELKLTVISQASSALNVVSEQPEQHGTPQHIEAEKLLLVATKKRQAALDEIQRLKAEGALGKRNYWSQVEDSCRGSISISNIALPLKQSFLNKEVNESVYHLLVLVRHRDQVITSQMQKIPDGIMEGALTFPNLMSLHDLTADFNIALEVYSLKIDNSHGSHSKKEFKKDHSRMTLTPLKRLQKESRMSSPAICSPGGPYAIRSSSFCLVGFVHLNINTLLRNAWTLEKVPFSSPLDGHLLMRVSVSMEGGITEKSFLTMFEDVGGFGAWNRRWCVLSGPFLKYWNYPDDETKKDCVGQLDLRMCTTRKVELVSRDICARQFTFELILVRPARRNDRTDLVNEVRDSAVISRILLSADSKEERILWCNKLNRILANIRAWDPDALRPEDYHV